MTKTRQWISHQCKKTPILFAHFDHIHNTNIFLTKEYVVIHCLIFLTDFLNNYSDSKFQTSKVLVNIINNAI